MSKRRVASETDDEGSLPGTPASKRARTLDQDERPTRPNGRGGGATTTRKAKADDVSDGSGDDDEDMEGNGEDDTQFEERISDAVLAAMHSKRNTAGGIAEHGIIESIEMHQFMCHKFLSFGFGPQINFIIGHNGSGKSAVLSAITVALGGKAAATGRANGLKSFIREGQSVAEVTIQIKNQGEEAYRPKEYGKSIVITRRFTKDGSSTWKIQSKEGKTISTKKEELAAICDHMNIQVDNPMNVLTQDAARQFLSASSPSDMYKFFLKGTQLSQLSEEYQICIENVDHTAKIIGQKKEIIPDLQAAYSEAATRYKEAEKARDQKQRVDELKKELAWTFVNEKERELQTKFEEIARQERRITKLEGNLKDAEALFKKQSEAVAKAEEAHENYPHVEHLTAQKRTLSEEARSKKSELNNLGSELRQMNASYQAAKDTIQAIQDQIDQETHRLASDTQTKRDEHNRQLEHANEIIRSKKEEIPNINNQIRQVQEELDQVKSQGEGLTNDRKLAQEAVNHAQNMIAQADDMEKNRYAAYGRGMQQLITRIQSSRWHGETPVGPLGIHVKCRDPETWGDLLRGQLGSLLTAFAVTDSRDSPELRKMLKSSGNEHLLVIIAQKDLFDYSHGEPPEEMLTVLRALEISDPYVLRVLINQASIERMFLGHTRREGEDTLRQYGKAGQAWTRDGFLLRRFPEGGESGGPIPQRRNDSTSTLLTGRDAKSQRQYYNKQKSDHERIVMDLNRQIEDLKGQFRHKMNVIEKLTNDAKNAQIALDRAKARVNQLNEAAQEDMPANIAGLEASKQESELEKESLEAQFKDITERETTLKEALAQLQNRQAEVRVQLDEHEHHRGKLQEAVEHAAELRVKAQHELQYMHSKLLDEKNKLHELQAVGEVLQKEFEDWSAKALEYCPKVETRRTQQEVQRLLDSTQTALRNREKAEGRSVEEMTIEVNRAKLALDTVQSELRGMALLNRKLKKSLMTRISRWQEFRRHIALRSKFAFQFNLSHRGYYGKVVFEHEKETLSLKVQTEDVALTQQQQQGDRDKDPKSLSGGEKSFATISLLLALWEAIGCPLRCLDEFDVFMDAVNRRISMKMMIDTANASDKKQYVLITPQDMNNITVGASVRVHRMTDPERGQGTLAFSG